MFWAPAEGYYGCGYCPLVIPMFQELETEYWGKIDFVSLRADVEEVLPVLDRYGVYDGAYGLRRPHAIFITPEGDMVRHFLFPRRGTLGGLGPEDFHFTFDRYLAGEVVN